MRDFWAVENKSTLGKTHNQVMAAENKSTLGKTQNQVMAATS